MSSISKIVKDHDMEVRVLELSDYIVRKFWVAESVCWNTTALLLESANLLESGMQR